MIKVLGARVVIKEDAPEVATKSGIVIPDKAQSKAYQGEVVAVGPGHTTLSNGTIPVGVKVGDNVIFAKFAGATVEVDKEEYIIINERDILAVI